MYDKAFHIFIYGVFDYVSVLEYLKNIVFNYSATYIIVTSSVYKIYLNRHDRNV